MGSALLDHALALKFVDCFTIGAESQVDLQALVQRIPRAAQRDWQA